MICKWWWLSGWKNQSIILCMYACNIWELEVIQKTEWNQCYRSNYGGKTFMMLHLKHIFKAQIQTYYLLRQSILDKSTVTCNFTFTFVPWWWNDLVKSMRATEWPFLRNGWRRIYLVNTWFSNNSTPYLYFIYLSDLHLSSLFVCLK